MMGNKKEFFIKDSKISFLSGAAAGIALFATIGFIILLVSILSNGDSSNKEDDSVVVNNPTPTQGPPAPTGPVDIKITKDDNVRGNSDAKITFIEFSDFQCPYCNKFYPTVEKIMDEYGDDIRLVYKHFPLDSIHPEARPAAEASECAAEQGKFWEFAGELFGNQSQLGDAYYKQLAKNLGLKSSKFNDCVDSQKYKDKVETDYQAGLAAGVQGTPASFLNGRLVSGAQPFETVKAAIESLL